jgi:LCP family protein required for cell wall assembly
MESTNADLSPSYRPRHTAGQRAILALSITVIIGCLAGAGALLVGKHELDGRLQTAKVDVTAGSNSVTPNTDANGSTVPTVPPETFPLADPQAQNFLIVGNDAHACVDPGSPWAGAADPSRENTGARSDTIMVMRVDPTSNQAAVLSFPRDLWVHIPGRGKSKINSAYVKDDYSTLAQVLFDEFGITVDHYIQVDFCAFKRIVDGVGGVSVPFETSLKDTHTGINIASPNGTTKATYCHTFIGDEALAYVRSRHLKWLDENGKWHEDRGSDLARISRQQDFLRRVLRTALDRGIFDPKVARALIQSLQTDVVTEEGFTIDDMLKFAGVMRNIDPAGIHTYQVEARGDTISGNSVLIAQLKGENMKAILAIFQGSAALVGAPTQVISTTTTAPGSTIAGATTTTAAPTTTVPAAANPADNSLGDIIPPKDFQC